jgi:hypothetical protein
MRAVLWPATTFGLADSVAQLLLLLLLLLLLCRGQVSLLRS